MSENLYSIRSFCAGTGNGAACSAQRTSMVKLHLGDLPRTFLAHAQCLSAKSSDWWRQVGAIAARDGKILGSAWNHHHPTEYSPYIDGDPRDGFSRGVRARSFDCGTC